MFLRGSLDILLYLITIIIALVVSGLMNQTNAKYQKIRNKANLTGKDVALKILQIENINDVDVVLGSSFVLSDNYNPQTKVVSLSEDVYSSTSIASLAVAAHELGHVIQHKRGYKFLFLRSIIVPVVSFSSQLIFPTLILGILTSSNFFYNIAILLLFAVLVFQIITLPVEIDASRRAIRVLKNNNFLQKDELYGAKKMLTVAAFTYIAAVFNTLVQILRVFLYRQRD